MQNSLSCEAEWIIQVMKKKFTKLQFTGLCVFLILFIVILLPLINFFLSFSIYEYKKVFLNSQIWKSVKESIIIAGFVVCITVPLSLLCSFGVTHTNVKHKNIFSIFCMIPIFLPPISFGFGILTVFGKNGLLNNILSVRISLLGRPGIVLGHVLYTFPVNFLLFKNALQKVNMVIYENAMLLGVSSHNFFLNIIVPQIKKTIATAIILTIIMSSTDFSICLVIGGKVKTLSLLIYRQVLGSLEFSSAIALGIMFIPFICLILFDVLFQQKEERIIYATNSIPESKCRDILFSIFLTCISVLVCIVMFPFLTMSFVENYPVKFSFTLKHILEVIGFPYRKYYLNSIVIAFSVTFIGCFLSMLSSYFACKSKKLLERRIFYIISTLPQIIPGLLVGIGYMLFYKGGAVYNTYWIIIMANIAHFFASPFLLSYHAYCNMSAEYDELAQLYGIPKRRMFIDVYIPYMQSTILDISFYFFANSMITISGVVFLYTSRTMPYSLILNNFEGSLEYLSKSSAVSLIIFLTNLCAFAITSILKRKCNQTIVPLISMPIKDFVSKK